MARGYSYDEVKSFIEGKDGNGCMLISTKYNDSHSKLKFQCACGKPFETTFGKFIHQNKRQCNDCGKLNQVKKQRKSKDQFLKDLRDTHGDEIIPLENYQGARKNIWFKHIICNHEWRASPDNILNGKTFCPKCSYSSRDIEEFKELVNEKFGEEYIVTGEYINSRTSTTIFHKTCNNEFEATPDLILNNLPSLLKDQCPKCSIHHLKTTDEFKNEVYNLVKDEYTVLGEYTGARNSTLMRHNTCGNKYFVTPDSFLNREAKCLCRTISNGELSILNFLKNNNIKFIQQIRFKKCKNKFTLPFDFGVFDSKDNLKYLIEFDGKQHYEPIRYFGGIDSFKKLKHNDEIKNTYCINNSIPLIRIPYWDFSNVENILKNKLRNLESEFNSDSFLCAKNEEVK